MREAVAGRPEVSSAESLRATAFEALAAEHLDHSYGLASAILSDRREAEDAVHDAFESAWSKWSTLRDPALFEAWFRRVLINECRDRLRRRSHRTVHDVSAQLAVATDDGFAATDDRVALDAALARLTPDDQVLLALRYFKDLKVDDIATTLGVRPGTVMARLHHALGRLRAIMDDGQGVKP